MFWGSLRAECIDFTAIEGAEDQQLMNPIELGLLRPCLSILVVVVFFGRLIEFADVVVKLSLSREADGKDRKSLALGIVEAPER